MKQLVAIVVLIFGVCLDAEADVWKWVDSLGNTHFVDTMTPIYTWADEFGKVHYSDTPDHEDAVSVQLVWHSAGELDDTGSGDAAATDSAGDAQAGQTDAEREAAEEYYCTRATEVYDSYVNAPQLYTTNDAGERVFLSEQEAAATIADTKARVDRYCR